MTLYTWRTSCISGRFLLTLTVQVCIIVEKFYPKSGKENFLTLSLRPEYTTLWVCLHEMLTKY